MSSEKNKEIRVGLVSIAGILLAIAGISLGKGWFGGATGTELLLKFPHSSGIAMHDPVTVSGVDRGRVESINNIDGGVQIVATIDDISDFKEDASARILLLEITGGKKIDINPGKSEIPFNPENIIAGTTPADLPELIATLGGVSSEAITLMRRLDTISVALTALLSDEKFVNDIKSTFQSASELSSDINQIIKNNRGKIENSIADISDIIDKLRNSIDRNEPKVSSIIDELDKSITNLQPLIGKSSESLDSLDRLIANLNDISTQVKDPEGSIGRLLYDKELSNRLDSTLTELSEFIKKMNKYGINVNVGLGHEP